MTRLRRMKRPKVTPRLRPRNGMCDLDGTPSSRSRQDESGEGKRLKRAVPGPLVVGPDVQHIGAFWKAAGVPLPRGDAGREALHQVPRLVWELEPERKDWVGAVRQVGGRGEGDGGAHRPRRTNVRD